MALEVVKRWLGGTDEPVDRRRALENRSIFWMPIGHRGTGEPASRSSYALFVRQPVLRQVRRHLSSQPREALFGFLGGHLVEGEGPHDSSVVVERALAAGFPMPIREEFHQFHQALEAAGRRTAQEGRQLVGWYQNRGMLGLALTESDRTIHAECFPEPWQCVLVLAPGRDGPVGGFFQRLDHRLYFGRELVPFFEVTESADASGPRQTVVDWMNHRAAADVAFADPGPSAVPSPGRPILASTIGEPSVAAAPEEATVTSGPDDGPAAGMPEDGHVAAPPRQDASAGVPAPVPEGEGNREESGADRSVGKRSRTPAGGHGEAGLHPRRPPGSSGRSDPAATAAGYSTEAPAATALPGDREGGELPLILLPPGDPGWGPWRALSEWIRRLLR